MVRKRRIIFNDPETFDQIRAFGWVKGKLKGVSMHDDLSLPILNHITRMLDDASFTEWLETILYNRIKDKKKQYEIDKLIQLFALDDPEGLTNDDIHSMYGGNECGGMFTPEGFGGMFGGLSISDTYGGQGFGGMFGGGTSEPW